MERSTILRDYSNYQFMANPTTYEKQAVWSYGVAGYRPINQILRDPVKFMQQNGEVLVKDTKYKIAQMDALMKRSLSDKPMVAYRGFNLPKGFNLADMGDFTLQDKGFTSVSLNTKVAKGFVDSMEASATREAGVIFKVRIPPKTRMIAKDAVSGELGNGGYEQEFILDRNTTLRFTGKKGTMDMPNFGGNKRITYYEVEVIQDPIQ